MKLNSLRINRRMGLLIFNLRWTILAAAAVLAIVNTQSNESQAVVIFLIGVIAIYNVILTLLEFVEYQAAWLVWLTVAADTILGFGLFWATRDVNGPLVWIGLLPALTIALRRGWLPALITIAAFNVAQAVFVFILEPNNLTTLVPVGIAAAALWPTLIGIALIAERVIGVLTATERAERQVDEQVARTLREHARAIYDMSSMVSATLDYNKVLDAALNFGARGSGSATEAYGGLTSAVLTFSEDQLHVTSSWRLPPADQKLLCPAREGVLAEVIRTGDEKIIRNPGQDPELKQFVAFAPCKTMLVFPLRVRFETYGAILYAHPQPDFFTEDVQAFLSAVVNQAIIALQNAQLYHDLRAEKERLVDVQEEAQKKLARDLHDGPTQSVAALAMRANFTRRLMERDAKAAADELVKMEDLARKTTKEIRHMLFTLRPLVLESQGLTAALQQLAEKMRETHDQNVIVEAEAGVDEKLEKSQQGVLFYITEEAVGNARKHAQAQHIWIRLKTQRDILVLEIQDDGVGFNVGAVNTNYEKRGSLGMVNMRERAEMLDGAVKLDSEEGKGTRITILVPLTPDAAQRIRG